jgi:excinuclease ABC A subunit
VGEAQAYFENLELAGRRGQIADKILKELRSRLGFLVNVGLDYLTLDRSADTLSGGEAQRIRLASQIGAGLVGVMYILDEPSIGLHQRDNERLLATLTHLRDIGNTVIVVEHDEDAIRAADHLIDIGPGAGAHGGEIVAAGTRWTSWPRRAPSPATTSPGAARSRCRRDARHATPSASWCCAAPAGNNLKNVTASIPVGLFTCVTGVSGSGKSTLVNNTLYPLAATALNGASTLDAARTARSRARALRQVHRHRPEPDRAHAALQPGDLHRAVHTDPRTVRRHPGGALARLRAGPLQLQREGRALRGLPGRRRDARSKCTSCPTSTCPATSARGSATTARRSTSCTRAATSATCWK